MTEVFDFFYGKIQIENVLKTIRMDERMKRTLHELAGTLLRQNLYFCTSKASKPSIPLDKRMKNEKRNENKSTGQANETARPTS